MRSAHSLPAYPRERIAIAHRSADAYTVILFAHNPELGGVATSAQVRKAIGKVPPDEPMLVAGHDFTQEATALLEARSVVIVRRGEYGWTDDSYRTLREYQS
jgi:hypothetical protein